MTIKFGYGNQYTHVFTALSKTLALSGLFGVDVTANNLTVYNVTRSAYMLGGNSSATGTVVKTLVSGLPVFTVTLSAIPASSADGDTLIISMDVADSVALYVATAMIANNTIPA